MYIPDNFVYAGACYLGYRILGPLLGCQSIGGKLALRGMLVGCRKIPNGGIWHCDVCALYRSPVEIILLGAMVVFATMGVWKIW